MGDIFKAYGKNKETILGKPMKIYGKVNKNGVLGKTKYIKYKKEFVKLSAYIKANTPKRSLTRLGRHKRVTVIDNISDIKNKKIRNLYLKTFKKNAKLYIFADNKQWKGGEVRYLHDRDKPELRKRNGRFIHDFKIEGTNAMNTIITSPTTELDYMPMVDDITERMLGFGFDTPSSKMFEGINNLKYTIKGKNDTETYYIRPSIEFVPYDKVIIYFYIAKKGGFAQGTSTDNKWIRMSIHITIFLKLMTETVIEDSQYKLFSGHLHITTEKDNNKRYNIKTSLKGSSTHTYLLGEDMEEMVKIMDTKGDDIFKEWIFDNTAPEVSVEEKALQFTLYTPNTPNNDMWGECRNGNESEKLLMRNQEKKQIFDNCFKNMRFIFCNIFNILKSDTFPTTIDSRCLPDEIRVKKITRPSPGGTSVGTSVGSSVGTDTYLNYKVPNAANYKNKINLSYVKFNGIINVNDLKKKKDTLSKPRSHTDTHHSGPPLTTRSPPIERKRAMSVGIFTDAHRGRSDGMAISPPRARSGDIPRPQYRSPPRPHGERRPSPYREQRRSPPREQRREQQIANQGNRSRSPSRLPPLHPPYPLPPKSDGYRRVW
jgi:hypothetical protein